MTTIRKAKPVTEPAIPEILVRQDATVNLLKPAGRDIQPGDIVVFRFSHIGLAVSRPDANGIVETIDGNTDGDGSREGGAVFVKRRSLSKVRSRIRFTV